MARRGCSRLARRSCRTGRTPACGSTSARTACPALSRRARSGMPRATSARWSTGRATWEGGRRCTPTSSARPRSCVRCSTSRCSIRRAPASTAWMRSRRFTTRSSPRLGSPTSPPRLPPRSPRKAGAGVASLPRSRARSRPAGSVRRRAQAGRRERRRVRARVGADEERTIGANAWGTPLSCGCLTGRTFRGSTCARSPLATIL
mmetsp:Transcript_34919/g.59822  ORF Transcript_34919/g.59822 Transcript_34919/m.59822 type:complete len:204 (-) Transcript_34919:516-1127(-)